MWLLGLVGGVPGGRGWEVESGERARRGQFCRPRSRGSRREELEAWVAAWGRSHRAEEGLVGEGL